MGCPPDPMEVSLWRSRERTLESNHKAEALSEEFEQLLKELAPLISSANEIPGIKALWELYLQRAEEPGPDAEETGYANTLEEELSLAFTEENRKEELVKAQEKRLCTLRDFLVNAWEIKEVKERFSAMQAFMEQETANQALHREDDRKTWLAWLKEKKTGLEWVLTHRKDTEYKEQYRACISRVDEEMKRVKALTSRQILMDCTLFGRNPQDFEPFGA